MSSPLLRRRVSGLIPCFLFLLLLRSQVGLAQSTLERVSCGDARMANPHAYWTIEYAGEVWEFAIDMELVGVQSGDGIYSGFPDPAVSVSVHNGKKLRWQNVGGRVACYLQTTRLPDGRIIYDRYYDLYQTYGTFGYVNADCEYQIEYDPETCNEDPDDGGGGGDHTTDGPIPDPDDGGQMCAELQLTPGCYDVYVDGSYYNTICCP